MRLIATFAAFIVFAAPAAAADFTVNVTTDAHDQAVGDGLCKDAGGHCTLRAALEQANGQAGADAVIVPAGAYTLTLANSLPVSSEMTIRGAGARTTIIDGYESLAALELSGAANATVSGLAFTSAAYGVLVRSGKLDGDGVTIRDIAPPPGNMVNGAGLSVYQDARATLRNSAIVHNVGGGGLVEGGGVYNGGGTVVLRRTTVAGNTGTTNTLGGGIYSTMGSLTLDHVTLFGNSAPFGYGGNLYTAGPAATVEDSIIAGGTAPQDANCGGTAPVTKGRNLAGDAGCAFGSDQLVGDPVFGALGDHGGPTDTLLAPPGSPVIDAASPCGTDDVLDQRGNTVPGTRCDIGAVELGAARSVTVQSSAGEVAPGGAVTLIATATNAGSDDSQDTKVSFDLPAGASADLVSSPTGTCAGTSCSFGQLPRDGKASVTLALRLPITPGPVTTTARVSGATPDPSAADDAASVTTTVTTPTQTPTPTPTPAQTPTATPTADTKAPVLTKLRVVRRRTLAFTVSEAATIRVGIRRRGKPLRSESKRVKAGMQRLRLPRRRGWLRLTVTATDAAGNRSAAKRLMVRTRK